jgi:hypothetical protein
MVNQREGQSEERVNGNLAYLTNYRTTDHVFTLLTLDKKTNQKKGKIISCFVDLKNVYSLWHKGLLF